MKKAKLRLEAVQRKGLTMKAFEQEMQPKWFSQPSQVKSIAVVLEDPDESQEIDEKTLDEDCYSTINTAPWGILALT